MLIIVCTFYLIDGFKYYVKTNKIFLFPAGKCVEFLLRQAQSLNLPSNIYYMAPGKPIIVITWLGQKPELPSILLNSHMDVVPVYSVNITVL